MGVFLFIFKFYNHSPKGNQGLCLKVKTSFWEFAAV